jgi:hypothetical protein
MLYYCIGAKLNKEHVNPLLTIIYFNLKLLLLRNELNAEGFLKLVKNFKRAS